ncbi:MAG: DUF4340 domain-containing protein [Oscillospiraceae bacterium]|nr:DUF4340 domain-containing protein [Oscillospiraceae bacterium]
MRRKTLIISIIAVVLLSAGIAMLMFLPQGEPEDAQPELPAVEQTTRIDLIGLTRDEVLRVTFVPQEGATYSLINDTQDDVFSVFLDAADPIFSGNSSLMQSVWSNAISLRNVPVIAENADDEELQNFGLVEPVLTWHVEKADGSAESFMLGAAQVAGTGRFARSENSRDVVILNAHQSAMLMNTLEDMYDITIVPDEILFRAESLMHVFDRIVLERPDTLIKLNRLTIEEQLALPLGTAMFQMIEPTSGDANDHTVQTIFLEDIIEIEPSSVVEVRPADLSQYGLDNPSRLTLVSYDWETTLLIGNRNEEGTGTYVMIEGYDAVLLDEVGEYLFLGVDPVMLRGRLVWLHNINYVDSVAFDLEGETRMLRLEHDFENESLTGFLDDVEIGDANARRLYIGALRVIQDGSSDEPVPHHTVPPNYTITINMLDGTTDMLQLFALNPSQFLIVQNGESTGFFITRMTLQDVLLSRFDMLDRGEDLPMS